MGMTVGDLKRTLEDYEDDMEVRLLSQETWPFEYSVRSVAEGFEGARSTEFSDYGDDEVENGELPDEDAPRFVYMVEGEQLGYASKTLFSR